MTIAGIALDDVAAACGLSTAQYLLRLSAEGPAILKRLPGMG
jgi:hypothetical protein